MTTRHLPHGFADQSPNKRLIMVGLCLENAVGSGDGPDLVYGTLNHLKAVKLSHVELAAALRSVKEETSIQECWTWNTCNRFEVYALCDQDSESVLHEIIHRFFWPLAEQKDVLNVFEGAAAVHHLLRTASGLNSGLPGELDVQDQLTAGRALAQCLGALGESGNALLDWVEQTVAEARTTTEWSQFKPSYCQAAIEGALLEQDRQDVLRGPVVIVGSSTTSRTCVEVLEETYHVDPELVTFFHRCHKSNGQVKSIRRAVQGCHRRRVNDYADPEITETVAHASLAIFGIDRDQPVLDGDVLRELRQGIERPLVVLDFNTMGSTQNLATGDGITFYDARRLEHAVRLYSAKMRKDPVFWRAICQVERLLIKRLESYLSNLSFATSDSLATANSGVNA